MRLNTIIVYDRQASSITEGLSTIIRPQEPDFTVKAYHLTLLMLYQLFNTFSGGNLPKLEGLKAAAV